MTTQQPEGKKEKYVNYRNHSMVVTSMRKLNDKALLKGFWSWQK